MNLSLKVLESECTDLTALMVVLYNQKYQIEFDDRQRLLRIENITQSDVEKIRSIFNSQGVSFIPVEENTMDAQAVENAFSELIQNCPESSRRRFFKSISKMLSYKSYINEKACAQLLETFHTLVSEYYIPSNILFKLISLMRQELELKYFAQNASNVSVGDIVSCNFGIGLPEEFTGSRIFALVCDKDSIGQIFVLPIVKNSRNIPTNLTLKLTAGINVTFDNDRYASGIVLLNRGVYINPRRITEIVGKISNDALIQILYDLPNVYDFTHIFDHDITDDELPPLDDFVMDIPDISSMTEEKIECMDEVIHENSEATIENESNVDTSDKRSTEADEEEKVEEESALKDTSKKVTSIKEELLINTFSEALNGLKNAKGVPGERIECFMDAIKMPKTNEALLCSFLVSIVNVFPSYDSLAQKLLVSYDFHSDKMSEQLSKELKSSFNAWIKQYPELKARYSNISLPALLRIFNKYYTP